MIREYLKEIFSKFKSALIEIIVNSIITTLIISFPKSKQENDLRLRLNLSNIIFMIIVFLLFLLVFKSKYFILIIGISLIISFILTGFIGYWLKYIQKSIEEKIGNIRFYRVIIYSHIFFLILGLTTGFLSILFFFLEILPIYKILNIGLLEKIIGNSSDNFENLYLFLSTSSILLSFSIILLGINKFFYSFVLNTLEKLLLPPVHIIYFATKNELIDIKRSHNVNEQFSTFMDNYRGYILIPWNVRDKFRNPYVEGYNEENFYEYMLKRLIRYFINIKNREASRKYTPLFIVYIFNIFIPIFVFIGLLGVMDILKPHIDRSLVVMYVSLFFVIWYLFFLRLFLLMLPSNILQILGKYIYKNLIDNIHLVIKKPTGITEEINIYEVLNRTDFSKQDLESANQIFQIVVVIILTLSIAGFIAYK